MGTVAVLLFAMMGALIVNKSAAVDAAIARNREIDAAFRAEAAFVEDWRRANGRLPTYQEFEGNTPWRWGSPNYAKFSTAGFPRNALDALGPPAAGGYLLEHWTGEWMEYYASWAGRSTVRLDRRDYYLFGSAGADILACAAVSAVLGWAGLRLVAAER